MAEHTCVFEWRYGSRELRELFTVRNIVKTYMKVEVALLKALGEAGLAPRECYGEVEKCIENIDPMEIYRMETTIGHDIASIPFILGEKCGVCGGYVHLGATSYDIIDTTWSLIIREALYLLKGKLKRIISKLLDYIEKYVDLPMIGRTHGQHALPVTLGFKLANYTYELARSYERLVESEKRILRLKMSGSVGTMASWGEKGLEVERIVARELLLEPHLITTQVAPRDGFAELVSIIAILASQLDRLALEVRELSRPEIGELYEGGERVGSSAMPHKKNPVTAERISSLAKIARSLVVVALENIPLMHERDLTNSASERILIPHILLTLDQILEDTLKLLDILEIDKEAMKRNLELTRGAVYSEILVTKLVEKGLSRMKAYTKIRDLTKKITKENTLVELVLRDQELSKYLTYEELTEITTPEYTIKVVRDIVNRTIKWVKTVLKEDTSIELHVE